MARTPKPAKGTTAVQEAPDPELATMKRRATTYANENCASIKIVRRGGELFMLALGEPRPGDEAVATIHPRF